MIDFGLATQLKIVFFNSEDKIYIKLEARIMTLFKHSNVVDYKTTFEIFPNEELR